MKKLEIEGKVDWQGRPAVKGKHGGLQASFFVLVLFAFENVASIALAVNAASYFNKVMHYDLADAANEVTNFMAVSYILSIVVALFADTYIGRSRAVVISGFLEIFGFALLTIQAHYPKLKPPACDLFAKNADCEKVNGVHAFLLFISLYILALGSAGTKAAAPTHGADQFDEKDPKEANQMSSFFNFLLLAICIGGSVSLTLVIWIETDKGWDLGFGFSTLAVFLGVLIFVLSLPLHRNHVIHGTTAVIEIIQVYAAALGNRTLALPEDPAELYELDKDKEAALELEFLPHRDIFRFLDKAAVQPASVTEFDKPDAPNPWKLCRVTQVENAKILLGMVPIFCCTIIMTLCLAQLQTFSVGQGLTMDTKIVKSFHIPPASLPIIPVVFLVVLAPVYDQIIVPILRNFTGLPTGITHLQRVGVGLILSSVSMAVAAIIEVKRKNVARDHNMLDATPVVEPLPITVFWLAIQYFIFGIADLFTYVGLLEFFYSEAPSAMKSISTCFLWTSMALGYFLSTILVKIVDAATKNITHSKGWLAGNNINRNFLNLFYWLLALLSFINFCVYLIFSKRYKYRPDRSMVRK